MSSEDATPWQLTANALDHHATVKALTEALPGWLRESDESANHGAADTMATSLARQGLALVEIAPADRPRAAEAEAAWFGGQG